MLYTLTDLFGYELAAADGDIGRVNDVLFDDQAWTIRYVVIDTGTWLSGRLVLVAPQALGTPDDGARRIPVSLTCGQIEQSPTIDDHQPVSRQHQAALADYYGWAPYWAPAPFPLGTPPAVGGPGSSEALVAAHEAESQYDQNVPDDQSAEPDLHLRSAREVVDYHIHATDGKIGHVEDFVASLDDWAIRQLVIGTRNWLPGGRTVVIDPKRIDRVDWDEKQVYVNATSKQIKTSDAFAPETVGHDV